MLLLSLLLPTLSSPSSPNASPLASQFKVDKLPLSPPLPFALYSGYVTVDATAGRALHWVYLDASERDPSTAPLQVWQTGGPGCSSLLGLFEEMGPLRVTAEGLELDTASWNTLANGLYIESPAGVGFSYSNTSADYINVTNDRTAQDFYKALVVLTHTVFPGLAKAPMWLTAESFGGMYNPNLALAILAGNKANPSTPLKLAGMQTGNAWTVPELDNIGALDTIWQRALAPKVWIDEVKKQCNLTNVGPLHAESLASDACDAAIEKAQSVFDDINIYSIYTDLCNRSPAALHSARALARAGSPAHRLLLGAAESQGLSDEGEGPAFDPCVDNELDSYLNRLDVQQALHIHNAPVTWSACSSEVVYSTDDILHTNSIAGHKAMWAAGLPDLVYSGDTDAIVPTMGTLNWINSLNLTIAEEWRPWHHADEYGSQTGGMMQSYQEGLTFATVHNAGHEVPLYQPGRALAMFASFLQHETLPE